MRLNFLQSLVAATVLPLLLLLSLPTADGSSSSSSSSSSSRGAENQRQLLMKRLYAAAAGEIAKDPTRFAAGLQAAAAVTSGRIRSGSNEEVRSPECGLVFSSLLSTVLALVGGGADQLDLDEFIKWLDSVGKPEAGILLGNVKWIGSREECEALRLPIYQDASNASSVMFHTSGRYCTFKVKGNGTAFSGDLGAQLQSNLEFALCMPNPCKGRDAEIATNFVIQTVLGLLGPILQGIPGIGGILDGLKDFALVVEGCSITNQEAKSSLQYGSIAMLIITALLVALILTATLVIGILECRGYSLTGVHTNICRAFCLRSNLTKLFAPPSTDSLACLNGIRVLSIFWVILGHSLLVIAGFLDNPLMLLNDYRKRWQAVLIINATTSVDSFFLLSGTLVAYIFFKRLLQASSGGAKTLSSAKFWLLYYFHRYWRLTPPLMFFVFWQLSLSRYFGEGALLPKDRRRSGDMANCDRHWWTLPLYVQNFVHVNEGCLGHTWYLANDMQMYLVSPLMLLPFFFGGIKLGSIVSVIVVAISMVCTGVINFSYGFRRGHLNFVPGQVDGYDPDTSYYDKVYTKPYCRIGAYAIGILLGYVLATRKSIRLPWPVVVVGWLVAAAGSLALLYLVQPQIAGTSGELTLAQVTTYWAFLRPGFALCVAWVVFACVYGYGGPVNLILSWSWFAPLARLTYCTYIVHISVMYMFYGTYDAKFHLSDSMLIMVFLANVMASFLASLVLSMLIEAPLLGLEKALLSPGEGEDTRGGGPGREPATNGSSAKLELSEYGSAGNFRGQDEGGGVGGGTAAYYSQEKLARFPL